MGEFMGRHDHCAYNQTRECFLALEIGELNFHTAKPADLSISFAFNSGEGLWLTPFKEIPLTEMDVPVDLVFLDEGDSVIEVVESSSTFGRLQVDPRIASLLLVPRHTIYSSQTQAADQLIICMAGEMASRLERISELTSAGMVQRAALLNLAPSEDGAPEEEPSPVGSRIAAAGSTESTQVDFAVNKEEVVFNPPGNWLTRWWTPDPRKVRRLPVDNLVAYYWTGATPTAQAIRDISSKGLYVVTQERWYPGTLVLFTLQRTDTEDGIGQCSIRVYTRAVRKGKDGVGLQFVLPETKDRVAEGKSLIGSVTKKGLETFLKGLRVAKC
jgi:hypothetical protein